MLWMLRRGMGQVPLNVVELLLERAAEVERYKRTAIRPKALNQYLLNERAINGESE